MNDKAKLAHDEKVKRILQKNEGIIAENPNNPENFICFACQSFSYKWISLDGHLKTQSHIKQVEQVTTDTLNQRDSEDKLNWKTSSTSLKGDEVSLNFRLTQFILENRLAFSLISPLTSLIKELVSNFIS